MVVIFIIKQVGSTCRHYFRYSQTAAPTPATTASRTPVHGFDAVEFLKLTGFKWEVPYHPAHSIC
eukprot:Skav209552  [mRNA]  locus=scaffold2497:376749:376943:- [translate_table: standard]